MFFSMEGVLMVGIGSVSVTFMGMPLEKIKAIPGYIKRFLFHKAQSSSEVIKLLSALAEKARRDGILALESEMSKLKDPFLAAGLKMAVDGIVQLGHALGVAVVATLYGAILANAIAGPIGDKLGMRSQEEILSREMMLQAILSIQAGDNPRVTQDKMMAF